MKNDNAMRAVVGRNIRNLRAKANVTSDDLRLEIRNYGYRWSPSRIAELERGEKPVHPTDLVVFSLALTNLSGRAVTVDDLLSTPERIDLSDDLDMDGQKFRDVLASRYDVKELRELRKTMTPGTQITARAFEDYLRRPRKRPETNAIMEVAEQLSQAAPPLSLADERARKRLNLEFPEYVRLVLSTWGHTLADEAERQVPPGASAQKRGHITRTLTAQLEDALHRGDD